MQLQEKQIEDIIYNSPWLLDERFVVPSIIGAAGPGRQVNVGKGKKRYIDLLFKDTRDNRPVIVELKKGELVRTNVAQILEYRALVISIDDDARVEWEKEFDKNYYCPKLILIGSYASDEVKMSANLAGIEIRTLLMDKNKVVDFGEIEQINSKLKVWNDFRKSGNRTLEDRDEWVKEIFKYVQESVEDYANPNVTTMGKLYETTKKDAYVSGLICPFLNIKIDYNGDYLCGLYEYYDEFAFSEESIYFDFLIQKIYNYEGEDEKILECLESRVKKILDEKAYKVISFNEGIATIKISRKTLNSSAQFKANLTKLIGDAVILNDELSKLLSE